MEMLSPSPTVCSTDEDARLAMLSNGGRVGDIRIGLSLSSRADMRNVVEAAVRRAMRLALDAADVAQQTRPSSAGSAGESADPERRNERERSRQKCRSRNDDRENGKGGGSSSTSSVGRPDEPRPGGGRLRRDRHPGTDRAEAGYRDGSGSETSSGCGGGGYANARSSRYKSGSPTVRITGDGGDRRGAEPNDDSDVGGGGPSGFDQSAYRRRLDAVPSLAMMHHRGLEFPYGDSRGPDNVAGAERVSEGVGRGRRGCVSLVPDTDAGPECKTEPVGFGRPGCVVALDNVPYRADFEDIVEFFENFGVTVENVVWWYTDVGKPSRKVRVNFNNPREAERAVRVLQNMIISNSAISLTLL